MQNIQSRKILGYDDVITSPAGESSEPMVDLGDIDRSIIFEYLKPDMQSYTGESMYLREKVARKLAKIENKLKDRGLGMKVVYGYRHPSVQEEYFSRRRRELALMFPTLSPQELDRVTHGFVAVPDVAGHPTGGAVDLTLIDADGELDMGTGIADYSNHEKIKTFNEDITDSQKANRLLLHDLMVEEGFAPFYGEWWHFSYGDREWAAFYGKKKALYGALKFSL